MTLTQRCPAGCGGWLLVPPGGPKGFYFPLNPPPPVKSPEELYAHRTEHPEEWCMAELWMCAKCFRRYARIKESVTVTLKEGTAITIPGGQFFDAPARRSWVVPKLDDEEGEEKEEPMIVTKEAPRL